MRSFFHSGIKSPIKYVTFKYMSLCSIACLLVCLPVSYREQKFYIFMKSNSPILSFMIHAFVFYHKYLPNPRSQKFSQVIASKIFILLDFTFKSMIHLSQFLYMVKIWHSFLKIVDMHLFQHYILSLLNSFVPLQKLIIHICVGLFLSTLFSSTDIFVYLYAYTTCLDCCCWYCNKSWNKVI